jgi:hypothetical protein
MSRIAWSFDAVTGIGEGTAGSDFAVNVVPVRDSPATPLDGGLYFAHVTVGNLMRERFSRPTRWGRFEELKELLEEALSEATPVQ